MDYYNEIDPKAAAWLRELIKQGLIPEGDVDERSIEDVVPSDLIGYRRHHFFAGIGGWAYALALAGWPDDQPVWTGSCPCQPFSSAGQGAGFDDERHLWPAWQHLIAQCRPPVIFGEQVASKAVDAWVDLVFDDLEALDYACAAVAYPAAGIGSPHIRDRTYWMADADSIGRKVEVFNGSGSGSSNRQRQTGIAGMRGAPGRLYHADHAGPQGHSGHGGAAGRQGSRGPAAATGVSGGLADADSGQRDGLPVIGGHVGFGNDAGRAEERGEPEPCGDLCGVADAKGARSPNRGPREAQPEPAEAGGSYGPAHPGPTNGHWRAADWLGCRDGKWRPVEPGTFPLAHGVPERVVRLRGYGNAIVPQQAAEFLSAWLAAKRDATTNEESTK